MSVFTPVSRSELETFLSAFDVGRLIDFSGIAGGSENSNFFVSCEQGEFVLTLIEREPVAAELGFFTRLLDALHTAGLPVPYAIRDREKRALHQLNGKPALLQPRLNGEHIDQPGVEHCAEVGRNLALLHDTTTASGLARDSDRWLDWMAAQGSSILPDLNAEDCALLEPVLASVERFRAHPPHLSGAVLHADLFRDNVLFQGNRLTGMIDFYNASSGWTLYDVAICVNDWCMNAEEQLDPERTKALLAAYAAKRRFSAADAECWPDMLRLAALRFWLSRRLAADQHGEQGGVLIKDPAHFQRILAGHRTVTVHLPIAF